jgi:hypothetical protein
VAATQAEASTAASPAGAPGALVARPLGHLFGRNVTRVAFKRGAYLRHFVHAFAEMLSPRLNAALIQRAMAGQGTDFDDLSRGSIGKLDPFIGSVQLPAGMPTGSGGGEAGGESPESGGESSSAGEAAWWGLLLSPRRRRLREARLWRRRQLLLPVLLLLRRRRLLLPLLLRR